MLTLLTQSGAPRVASGLFLVMVLALVPAAAGQDPLRPAERDPASSGQPSLTQRQQAVRERLQQLEGRMVMLAQILAESEPDQADRLRAALDWSGQKQVKRRLDRLVELLRDGQYSDADREQEALLADLNAMLKQLTDTADDFDRKRAARQRLEAVKQALRALQQQQLEHLYRTQAAPAGTDSAARAALRELERGQRALERQARDLATDLQPPREAAPETPGRERLGNASRHMQEAADRLGELQPVEAQSQQEAALEQLQRALDELDDALRQVRREELEETLTALEARFKSMLAREQQVRADVVTLNAKGVADWDRTDQLRLTEAAQTQHRVTTDCQSVVRILVTEGTTVILPELAEQLVADMQDAAADLDRGEPSAATQRRLDDIIELLTEIVAALEVQRQPGLLDMLHPPGGGPDAGVRALLPESAELKLLRSSQLRINALTAALAAGDVGGTTDVRPVLDRLAARQTHLMELARQMHERK